MRALLLAALALTLGACATERLSVSPPSGTDLSGSWKLNEADSDDPQHVLQAPNSHRNPNGDASPPQGRGGRGGRGAQGPGGTGGPGMQGGPGGPPPPGAGLLSAPLRFPGKQVDIKQVSGVVSFSSEGRTRVCQPGSGHKKRAKADYRDRDPSPGSRDNAPPVCGWEQAALVLLGGESDDDRPQFEEQYTLSADRQRLIETVVFRGGRSAGFTLSRVWDRVAK